jgi:hypothetical protein
MIRDSRPKSSVGRTGIVRSAMNSPMPASTHAERLLVEILCQREETAGHPLPEGLPDATAREQGGDLARRIRTRALNQPDAEADLREIGRVLAIGRGLAALLLLLTAIGGIVAAGAALGEGQSLSIPMILLTLVGVNLFMLLVWISLQVAGVRAPAWLVTVWGAVARRAGGFAATHGTKGAGFEAIRVLAHGPGARWRLGAVLHGAWFTYTFAGLTTLALLLVVRRYDLSWQTTLLSAEGLRELATVLSIAPRLLGAPGPESLPLSGALSAEDHRGWAQWILLAVLAYGLVPRLFALAVCAALSVRTQPHWERELARPGYARLRVRLMPDRREAVVVDRDTTAPPADTAASTPVVEPPPAQTLHGVALEWPAAMREATIARWRWFGSADDADGRAATLSQLRSATVTGLVIVVRATATPDRGLQRFVAELVAAARAPAWLALGDLSSLEARGTAARELRLDDWRRLAVGAGAVGGLVEWHAPTGEVRPVAHDRAAA